MNLIKIVKQIAATGFFLPFVFCPAQSAAQDSTLTAIQNQFNRYRQHALQEKLFAHTDKNFYLAGEILWFKLYNVDASFHQPLDLSKLAYVEILDNNNKPVLQAKIALKSGEGSGSFSLPVTISSGTYKLRAYTNWMKNGGADYFFEKAITIINPKKSTGKTLLEKTSQYDIQFFPEGGNLVENIQSRIAFKATDENGKGIECTGFIIDETNASIVQFKTFQFGIGSFYFTPSANHRYKAVIETAGKNKIVKELPVAFKEGYVMNLTNTGGDKITVSVQGSPQGAGEVYLLVHTRQLLKTAETAVIRNGKAVFEIDKYKLGDGISHFTVFNGARQPVCERLYFKLPQQKLLINLNADNNEYASRKKVSISIRSTDQHGKAQGASMSMAVYRLDSLQTADESTISSYLLITSDLKGVIESPGYYLKSPDKETEQATDNLMLTHGWRRFRWEEVLQNKTSSFAFVPEYNGHIVTGKITGVKNGNAAANITGYLSVPGLRTQFMPSVSEADGNVKFEMKEMYGSSEIIVQTDPFKDSLYKIDITDPFFENHSNNKFPGVKLSAEYADLLLDHFIGTQVQHIYTGNRLQQFNASIDDTNPFYVTPNAIYSLDNYTRFMTLEEVLREYVTQVNVRKKEGRYYLRVSDIPGNAPQKPAYPMFDTDPLVLLDGVALFDMNKLISYNSLKLKKLEVVGGKYFFGNSSFDGILNWTTYKGDLKDFELAPSAIVMDYEGLQLEREFYAPSYDDEQKAGSHLPDFRNVLCWAPGIHTNEKGLQQVSFFTSDVKGRYAVIVEGLAPDGKCGSAVTVFEIK